MAYSEKLASRIREALAHLPDVEEKKMFGGVAFMVKGKMCITAGKDGIMCRIDPALHEEAVKSEGAETVTMGGRVYKGYVHINEDAITTKKAFNHWIELALSFNEKAKASRKK